MSELASLNARPNDYRRVAYSEFENDHVHRLFRHFPELQQSLEQVKANQHCVGRNWVDRDPVRKEQPREVSFKSTRRLDELSKSSLEEVRAPMDQMRKILMKGRDKPSPLSNSSSFPSGVQSSSARGSVDRSTVPGGESSTGGETELEENARHLRSAELKVAKASLSFNPMGTTNALLGFQNADMNMDELDSQLRRSLCIVLTRRELLALFASMDADGSGAIDGVEFTRYFLQMGIDERKRHKMDVLRKTWAAEAREKAQREKEREHILRWQAEQIQTFTPADEASAHKKLETVALLWDSTSEINELKLRGFDMFLSPFDFKLQLSRSFDMHLSGAECGALLKRFITREGELACVNGNAFLKYFTFLKKKAKANHKSVLAQLAQRKLAVRSMGQQEVISSNLGR